MGDPNNLNLGFGGKMGEVDLQQIKAGIKKNDIKDQNLKSIFDFVDSDKNEVLDADEINIFKTKIKDVAGNDNLSKNEAKDYLKQFQTKNIEEENLFNFLKQLLTGSQNIKSSIVKDNNGKKTICVTYNDGKEETIYPDNSREIVSKDDDNNTITRYYDANGKLKSKKNVASNGQTELISYDNDGKPEKKEVKNGNVTETYSYGEDGKPEKKEVKSGNTVETYSYDENGTPVLDKKIKNNGLPIVEVTTYTRSEGDSVIVTIILGDKKTVQMHNGNTLISETITENGQTKVKNYIEGGYEEETDDGATKTVFNNEGKKLSQIKIVDGQQYEVKYDGVGNTKGIIVQNGESISALAKKFGCSEDDIKKINSELVRGEGANAGFKVGQEIKIPGELKANDPRLQGRATKEEAIKKFEAFNSERAAQVKAKKEAEEVDAQIQKDNELVAKEKEFRAEMQKQGKEIANAIYEDIKGAGTSKTFFENIQRINKDNVVEVIQGYTEKSPDESITEAIFDEFGLSLTDRKNSVLYMFNQLKARAKEKGINTSQVEVELAKVLSKQNGQVRINLKDFDPIFNSLCAAINGKSLLTKEERVEIQNTPVQELQENTITLLQDTVDGAEKALDNQLKQDGWSADLWEGIKWCTGSDNLDEKVKADIEVYKTQLATLQSAKSYDEFKAKFKEIYGVNYDPELVKAYQKRQERLPYVEITYALEENFNKKMAKLLASDKLVAIDEEGTDFSLPVHMSKEEVYNAELEKFAEFVGEGDKKLGKAEVEKAFKELGLSENASLDDKYKALHEIVKKYSEFLHENTMVATENKGYDAFIVEAENAYKAAFGIKNDITKRVADYNKSQQKGAMVVKGTLKCIGAVALTFVPGVGVVAAAVSTAAFNATVDLTDRVSSDVGLQEGEVLEILKNAAIDGGAVFAGGQLTKMLSKTSSFLEIGGQMVGDMAISAAAEKMQTGQITISGVVLECVFSATGNLVAMKQLKKVKTPPAAGNGKLRNSIEDNISPQAKNDLEQLRAGLTDPDVNLNGVFKKDNVKFTIKDGKIVEIKTVDGNVITDETKIARYKSKHEIDENTFSSVKSGNYGVPALNVGAVIYKHKIVKNVKKPVKIAAHEDQSQNTEWLEKAYNAQSPENKEWLKKALAEQLQGNYNPKFGVS